MVIHQFIDECLSQTELLAPFRTELNVQIEDFFSERPHGRSAEWEEFLSQLPDSTTDQFDLSTDTISASENLTLTPNQLTILQAFKPWRKGPFQIGNVTIDTEWRSDWKWQRIQPHIAPLVDRAVLDIGCGNGYHLLRMLGDGASLALGVDPTRLFLYQFQMLY